MISDVFKNLNQPQRERLSYIDFRLEFFGEMRRSDLVTRFGIKDAAATRDITLYRKQGLNNIEYDNQYKIYVRRDTYQSLFPRNYKQVIAALSLGLGDNFIGNNNIVVPVDMPDELGLPDLDFLASITRAIHRRQVISINYISLSSGFSCREIVPHALANTGLRWHVRAYDRKNNRFSDFVINRIDSITVSFSKISPRELADSDSDWQQFVALVLIPHPALKHVQSIKKEYKISDDSMTVNVRASLVGYFLRRWNVDCSTDHHLNSDEHHLWLSNVSTVSQNVDLTLAPK